MSFPARTVTIAGVTYKVFYEADGRVRAVHQRIIPLRHALYWRPLALHSRPAAAAVLAAARAQRAEEGDDAA